MESETFGKFLKALKDSGRIIRLAVVLGFVSVGLQPDRGLGTTLVSKANALGVKRPFSEQLSEFRDVLGATLGIALMTEAT